MAFKWLRCGVHHAKSLWCCQIHLRDLKGGRRPQVSCKILKSKYAKCQLSVSGMWQNNVLIIQGQGLWSRVEDAFLALLPGRSMRRMREWADFSKEKSNRCSTLEIFPLNFTYFMYILSCFNFKKYFLTLSLNSGEHFMQLNDTENPKRLSTETGGKACSHSSQWGGGNSSQENLFGDKTQISLWVHPKRQYWLGNHSLSGQHTSAKSLLQGILTQKISFDFDSHI